MSASSSMTSSTAVQLLQAELDKPHRVFALTVVLEETKDKIANATNNVANNQQGNVVKLATKFLSINTRVSVGLADTCAVLTKFVTKVIKILRRGPPTDADMTQLKPFGDRLNDEFITELQKFVKESTDDFLVLYSDLAADSHGDIKSLYDTRARLEAELLVIEREKLAAELEKGAAQGDIDRLTVEKEVAETAKDDLNAAKRRLQREIDELVQLARQLDEQLLRHRDTHHEERGSFWIFSWHVRNVHHDNGERIVRENMNRNADRLSGARQMLASLDSSRLDEKIAHCAAQIPIKTALRDAKEGEEKLIKDRYAKKKSEFDRVVENIKSIHEKAGTMSADAIIYVNQLASSVFNACTALTNGHAQVRTELLAIDYNDVDLLEMSAASAIQLLRIADNFNGTSSIPKIQALIKN